jgi:hypothetical protein
VDRYWQPTPRLELKGLRPSTITALQTGWKQLLLEDFALGRPHSLLRLPTSIMAPRLRKSTLRISTLPRQLQDREELMRPSSLPELELKRRAKLFPEATRRPRAYAWPFRPCLGPKATNASLKRIKREKR